MLWCYSWVFLLVWIGHMFCTTTFYTMTGVLGALRLFEDLYFESSARSESWALGRVLGGYCL